MLLLYLMMYFVVWFSQLRFSSLVDLLARASTCFRWFRSWAQWPPMRRTCSKDFLSRLCTWSIIECGRTNLSRRLRNILNTFVFSHQFVSICQVCRCLKWCWGEDPSRLHCLSSRCQFGTMIACKIWTARKKTSYKSYKTFRLSLASIVGRLCFGAWHTMGIEIVSLW